MQATLMIDTKNYQVFDLGYGATIISKTPADEAEIERFIFETEPSNKEDLKEASFNSVFFQGDDYLNFVKEVEAIEKNNLSPSQSDYVISQYSLVMSHLSTTKDLEKIGISPPTQKPSI